MRLKKTSIALATALSLVVGLAVLPNANAATTVKMVLWPGPEGDAMQKVVDSYNSSQGKKDGVTVKMILLSRDNTFAKEAALMKAKSSEYDIYFTASYLVGQHAPYLSDLKGVKDSLYLKASVDSLKVAGKQKALPLDTSLHFMYYRKDLIASLSANAAKYTSIAKTVLGKDLKPNTNPATWTWDDALATAAFFTQKYNPESPTKYGYALPAKNLLYNTMIWNDVLWGLGGNWLKNGKPNLNTPSGKAAIDVYNTIYTKGLTSPESSQWEYAETNSALTSGNAALALQWNAAYSELSTTGATKDQIGIAHRKQPNRPAAYFQNPRGKQPKRPAGALFFHRTTPRRNAAGEPGAQSPEPPAEGTQIYSRRASRHTLATPGGRCQNYPADRPAAKL